MCNLPKNLPKGFQEFPSFSEIFQLFSNVFPIQGKGLLYHILISNFAMRDQTRGALRRNRKQQNYNHLNMEKITMMGFAPNVKSSVTTCTIENLYAAMDAEKTAHICAEIEDALERVKRGEMAREDFETYKRDKKKELMVLTPHATFSDGQRQNKTAVPSGLSMYDVDHIADPRGYFNTLVKDRCRELGIVMAHVTPSTEGLRLIFEVPAGMTLAEAQKWMSEQLGDSSYDGSVKDYARCSFIVPRAYLLYIDEEELCKERTTQKAEITQKEPSLLCKNVEASDRNLRIFDLCLAEAGLKLEEIDQMGVYNWHNTLVSILSVGICRLMTQDELKAVLEGTGLSATHQRLLQGLHEDECAHESAPACHLCRERDGPEGQAHYHRRCAGRAASTDASQTAQVGQANAIERARRLQACLCDGPLPCPWCSPLRRALPLCRPHDARGHIHDQLRGSDVER